MADADCLSPNSLGALLGAAPWSRSSQGLGTPILDELGTAFEAREGLGRAPLLALDPRRGGGDVAVARALRHEGGLGGAVLRGGGAGEHDSGESARKGKRDPGEHDVSSCRLGLGAPDARPIYEQRSLL